MLFKDWFGGLRCSNLTNKSSPQDDNDQSAKQGIQGEEEEEEEEGGDPKTSMGGGTPSSSSSSLPRLRNPRVVPDNTDETTIRSKAIIILPSRIMNHIRASRLHHPHPPIREIILPELVSVTIAMATAMARPLL